jgi:hypothetical protein
LKGRQVGDLRLQGPSTLSLKAWRRQFRNGFSISAKRPVARGADDDIEAFMLLAERRL